MSSAESKNDKEPKGKGVGPTRSFDGSQALPGRQIGPFRIERELGRGAVGVSAFLDGLLKNTIRVSICLTKRFPCPSL